MLMMLMMLMMTVMTMSQPGPPPNHLRDVSQTHAHLHAHSTSNEKYYSDVLNRSTTEDVEGKGTNNVRNLRDYQNRNNNNNNGHPQKPAESLAVTLGHLRLLRHGYRTVSAHNNLKSSGKNRLDVCADDFREQSDDFDNVVRMHVPKTGTSFTLAVRRILHNCYGLGHQDFPGWEGKGWWK